ncbi:MAG: RlpA-like double-psi beta-barrel-protein domain-containing protein-containing protein [Linnemannia gamsii]|nr:MAG: RlpA-like double-psi beta-barrel-protein domain-containing protein-containing protein [Linnemannia gamsii]
MVFDNESTLTIGNLTDSENPLPSTTPISPKNLLNIVWNLSEAPKQSNPTTVNPVQPTKTATIPAVVPTITKTTTTTTKTTTTKTAKPTPKPTSNPGNGGSWYTGRATWYSDTHGQCEHNYSQSDMIVAVNEAQMGKGKNICGKKILVTEKNSNTQVVVTVVDMCPSQYCNFGDLDLSQGAFKKFAGLGVGVLKLTWTFM